MNEKENNSEYISELDLQVYLLMNEVDKRLLTEQREIYRDNGVDEEYCWIGLQMPVDPNSCLINEYIKAAIDPPYELTISAFGPYSLSGDDRSSPNQKMTTAILMKSGEIEKEYTFTYAPDERRKLSIIKDTKRVFGVREYDSMGTSVVDGSALIETLGITDRIALDELALLYKTVVELLR